MKNIGASIRKKSYKNNLFLYFYHYLTVGCCLCQVKFYVCSHSSLSARCSIRVADNGSGLCVRAGVFTTVFLLKTRISRIRQLSTEDGFPAWRIAVVVRCDSWI